jgi:hypothetical protein
MSVQSPNNGGNSEPSGSVAAQQYGATADDYVAGASAAPLPRHSAPGPKKRRLIFGAMVGGMLVAAPTFVLMAACSMR